MSIGTKEKTTESATITNGTTKRRHNMDTQVNNKQLELSFDILITDRGKNKSPVSNGDHIISAYAPTMTNLDEGGGTLGLFLGKHVCTAPLKKKNTLSEWSLS